MIDNSAAVTYRQYTRQYGCVEALAVTHILYYNKVFFRFIYAYTALLSWVLKQSKLLTIVESI